MTRKRPRKPRAQMGADLYYTVKESEIEKAGVLAGLLGGLPWQQVLGLPVAIQRNLAKLGAVDGRVPVPDPEVPKYLAAAAGWPVADAERFANALLCSGHIKAMAGPSGGYVVAGLEPYQEMKKRSEVLSQAGARGAETRKAKGGYGQAMTTPEPGNGQDEASASPEHGKQEHHHHQDHQHQQHPSSPTDAAGEGAPPATARDQPAPRKRAAKKASPPATDDGAPSTAAPSVVTLIRNGYAQAWQASGRTQPLSLPVAARANTSKGVKVGDLDYGAEGALWGQIAGLARQTLPTGATDEAIAARVFERLQAAGRLTKPVRNGNTWADAPKVHSLADFRAAFQECATPPTPRETPRPAVAERMAKPSQESGAVEVNTD